MGQIVPTVEAVVQNYFDGLYEGSADIARGDLPSVRRPALARKGRAAGFDVPDWLDRVRKRPSPKRRASRAGFHRGPSTIPTTLPLSSRCVANCRRGTSPDYLVAMKLSDGWPDRLEVLPLRHARVKPQL